MKRRDLIKGLGLSLGYVAATPTVFSLLQSCKTDADQWIPEFFTVEEGLVIKNLVDLILPKTEILPGALDVNVPEFLDLYAAKAYSPDHQIKLKRDIQEIINELLSLQPKVSKLTKENYDNLLSKYLKADQVVQISFKNNQRENVVFSALKNLRNTTVWAYKTSELIGETVLAYAPIPGKQQGCISLDEATGGKAWSL